MPIEGKGFLNNCQFCRRKCSCPRCKDLLQLNKMLGEYHAIGGSFEEEVLPEMMFLNLGSQRICMQLVTFLQCEHNQSTEHPVKLEEAACQQLTFA